MKTNSLPKKARKPPNVNLNFGKQDSQNYFESIWLTQIYCYVKLHMNNHYTDIDLSYSILVYIFWGGGTIKKGKVNKILPKAV